MDKDLIFKLLAMALNNDSTEKSIEPPKVLTEKPYVIIRTYSAGVHAGYLAHNDKKGHVILEKTRRIWRYQTQGESAVALNGVSKYGVSKGSKLDAEIDIIELIGVIEIIPCTDIAVKKIMEFVNDK